MGRSAQAAGRRRVMACVEHAGMPPTASIAALPDPRPLPEPASPGIRFGAIPITETGAFPPAPAPHCWVYVTVNAEIALSTRAGSTAQVSARARISVDGQWLWWALRRKYPGRAPAKLSGSDLIHVLARHCARKGQRLLLLGSACKRLAWVRRDRAPRSG